MAPGRLIVTSWLSNCGSDELGSLEDDEVIQEGLLGTRIYCNEANICLEKCDWTRRKNFIQFSPRYNFGILDWSNGL
ncbi:unnamed protein product [Caretta caretta]